MSVTYSQPITLITVVCSSCGITFGMPAVLHEQRQQKGGDFYCPNGHVLVYREPDVKRLERQLAQERQRLDQEKARCRDLETSLADEAKATAKLKKRVSCGICPCCKRSFRQLASHMKNKHPNFSATTEKPTP